MPQANPEPSPAGEGVETGRAAPNAYGSWRRDSPDHERRKVAAKAEVVRKSASLLRVRVRVPSSAPSAQLHADEEIEAVRLANNGAADPSMLLLPALIDIVPVIDGEVCPARGNSVHRRARRRTISASPEQQENRVPLSFA